MRTIVINPEVSIWKSWTPLYDLLHIRIPSYTIKSLRIPEYAFICIRKPSCKPSCNFICIHVPSDTFLKHPYAIVYIRTHSYISVYFPYNVVYLRIRFTNPACTSHYYRQTAGGNFAYPLPHKLKRSPSIWLTTTCIRLPYTYTILLTLKAGPCWTQCWSMRHYPALCIINWIAELWKRTIAWGWEATKEWMIAECTRSSIHSRDFVMT